MVKIEIRKGHVYFFVSLIVIVSLGFVLAQVGSVPNPGHDWSQIGNPPDTATRWADWSEVTGIPSDIADGDQVGITAETDPQVGIITDGQWCTGVGTEVVCNSPPPSAGHGDGTNCLLGQYSQGVDANGNAQGCTNDLDTSPTNEIQSLSCIRVEAGLSPVQIGSGNFYGGTAVCQQSYTVTGGGIYCSGSGAQITIPSGNGWNGVCNGPAQPDMKVWAVCCRI